MAGEWRTERFDQMAVLVRDTVNPSETPGLPYIGLEHIGEGTCQLLTTGVAEDATSPKTRFKTGDILFGKLRPYFRKVIRGPFDGICSTDIWVVRPRLGVNAVFLFYIMASELFVEPVVRASEGTKMPRANWHYAASLELPLPPIGEQEAIAHILGTLDDKIELNRRMNETLEAMARALFKSWFIDFDPVIDNALAAGNPIPAQFQQRAQTRAQRLKQKGAGQAAPTLPNEIRQLFPNQFQDSPLGPIPSGWRLGTLGDVADLNPETWSKSNRPETVVYVDLSNTKWGRIESTVSYSSANAPSRAQRVLRPGDTIFGTVRPGNGSFALISEQGLTGSTGFALLRPKSIRDRDFVYLAATEHENVARLARLADGAAYPAVRPDVVAATPLFVPQATLRDAFSQAVTGCQDRIAAAERESRTLAALRDTLLPKLISGDLRLDNPDQFLRHA